MDPLLNLVANVERGLQNSFVKGTFLDNKYFNPDYLFAKEQALWNYLANFTSNNHGDILSLYHGLLTFLALFFITIICYCIIRIFEIRKKEHQHLHQEIEEYAHRQKEREAKAAQNEDISHNPRWIKTLSYVFSENSGDWKLAVIEADSMLDELMGNLGFRGESLGEKLKSADQEKFRNLTQAWEVHTIRNRIAHEGVNFDLSQHEAKRIITIYENIFQEYGFI